MAQGELEISDEVLELWAEKHARGRDPLGGFAAEVHYCWTAPSYADRGLDSVEVRFGCGCRTLVLKSTGTILEQTLVCGKHRLIFQLAIQASAMEIGGEKWAI